MTASPRFGQSRTIALCQADLFAFAGAFASNPPPHSDDPLPMAEQPAGGPEGSPVFLVLPSLAARRAASQWKSAPPHWLDLVRAERVRQVEKFGQTADADDARDLFAFTKGAGRLLHAMNEGGSLHRLDEVERQAVKLIAYCAALIESCQRRNRGSELTA